MLKNISISFLLMIINISLAQVTSFERSGPESSMFPLIYIDTDGGNIIDDDKITAHMEIVYNNGLRNYSTDSAKGYNGRIGIEIRGNTSVNYPQKPYGIETRDSLGESNNVSLLGMPKENDWTLLSFYNDKTFLRNAIASNLFNQMGHYAPKTQICEVILNDEYQGLYLFTEKVKQDGDRVDIAKLDSDDNSEDSLTGGYIFKIDKGSVPSEGWNAKYKNPNYSNKRSKFMYVYPKADDITSQQKTYIEGYVDEVEDAIWSADFKDPLVGYRAHIDVTSFIDYLIVNELARNGDGFKKSRYLYKNRTSKDSLLYAGPVWDFDWAFKDISEYGWTNGTNWQHEYTGGSDTYPPGWYIRFMEDESFQNEFACRYFTLRSSVLDTMTIFNYIDSISTLALESEGRHFEKWPYLGINVGTPEIGSQPKTYVEEVTKIKQWLSDRLAWMDANMVGSLVGGNTVVFDVLPINSGEILINSKQPESYPWDNDYHSSCPVSVVAVPKEGYQFDSWSGENDSNEHTLSFDFTSNTSLIANFIEEQVETDIIFTEINYNSSNEISTKDWVEIYNNGIADKDLSGWMFKDGNDFNSFELPEGTVLGSGEYLVLARELASFSAINPNVNNVVGDFDFSLSGSGEQLRLYDQYSRLEAEVVYTDAFPWPLEADGEGATLELIDYDGDLSIPFNWFSNCDGGSPGIESYDGDCDTVLGTFKSVDNKLIISPNPIISNVQLSWPTRNEGIILVTMNSIDGTTVFNSQGTMSKINKEINQVLSSLNGGAYFISLKSDHLVEIEKVMIQK